MKLAQFLNILLILSFTEYVYPQFCSQTEANIDYKGNDIGMASYSTINSADICCQLCLAISNCRAFTYFSNTCFFKSSNAGRVASTNRIKIIFQNHIFNLVELRKII